MLADRIKKPILLIHGEDDNNSGTMTMQVHSSSHLMWFSEHDSSHLFCRWGDEEQGGIVGVLGFWCFGEWFFLKFDINADISWAEDGFKDRFWWVCWIFETYNVTQINCCVTNLLRHKVGFIVLVPSDQITVFSVSFVCSQSGFLVPWKVMGHSAG
jgi:hypothetical protein